MYLQVRVFLWIPEQTLIVWIHTLKSVVSKNVRKINH